MLWMLFGFFIFMLSEILPVTRLIMLHWIGVCLMFITPVMYIYHLKLTNTYRLFNKVGKQNALIPFLRRDGVVIPVLGSRVYSGESFLDVPGLGLIEDLGKGTVYSWGDKKVRFCLENISYTPDPKYMNLCAEYARLGFNNSDDVYRALIGDDLELMASSYLMMVDGKPVRGAKRLVDEIVANKGGKVIRFNPHPKSEGLHDKVDRLLGGGVYP